MVTDNLQIQKVDNFLHSDEVQLAFNQAIGDRNTGAYIMSVLLAIKNDESGKLALCTHQSIFNSALRAATLRLSVDPSTGQAYLVAYKDKATLIVGYKGLQDMAVRTNRYRYINVVERFEGQTTDADPISGLITLAGLGGSKTSNKIIGWLAAFEMLPEKGHALGYAHTLYMTVEQIHAHAKKHNPAGYGRTDVRAPWKVNREAMERKTVLRILLRQYGYLDPSDSAALMQVEQEAGEEPIEAAFVETNESDSAPEVQPDPREEESAPAYKFSDSKIVIIFAEAWNISKADTAKTLFEQRTAGTIPEYMTEAQAHGFAQGTPEPVG